MDMDNAMSILRPRTMISSVYKTHKSWIKFLIYDNLGPSSSTVENTYRLFSSLAILFICIYHKMIKRKRNAKVLLVV